VPGNRAKDDFVGWSGLAPVAGLFEYVFGLHADAPSGRLLWDVRLLDGHGVRGYPFGRDGVLDLSCAARSSATEEPEIQVRSTVPLELVIRWEGREKTVVTLGGETVQTKSGRADRAPGSDAGTPRRCWHI
jgi:hypothetical protein